jgi:hypothetical protein
VLSVVETDPFAVYTAKKYPGVVRKLLRKKERNKERKKKFFLKK